jgi:ketosteroid isomerase-like protein
MKNKVINGVLLLFFLSFILACNLKKEEPAPMVDKEQIKREIQAKEDAFAEIYNTGELKNIGYYAEDAITFFQNRPPLVGREAIVESLRADIEGNTNKISFATNEVFVSNDGVQVVEIGSYKVVDSVNTVINSGNYMSLFEKRDGNYYCLRDMSASELSLE